jgi:hypothetical protein
MIILLYNVQIFSLPHLVLDFLASKYAYMNARYYIAVDAEGFSCLN